MFPQMRSLSSSSYVPLSSFVFPAPNNSTTTTENPSDSKKENGNPVYSLIWVGHENNLLHTIQESSCSMVLTDTILQCEGFCFNCHRIVLASSSTLFYRIFTENPQVRESRRPLITVRGIRLKDFRPILDFVYRGFTRILKEDLVSVLEAALKLEVTSLVEALFKEQGPNQNRSQYLHPKPSKIQQGNPHGSVGVKSHIGNMKYSGLGENSYNCNGIRTPLQNQWEKPKEKSEKNQIRTGADDPSMPIVYPHALDIVVGTEIKTRNGNEMDFTTNLVLNQGEAPLAVKIPNAKLITEKIEIEDLDRKAAVEALLSLNVPRTNNLKK